MTPWIIIPIAGHLAAFVLGWIACNKYRQWREDLVEDAAFEALELEPHYSGAIIPPLMISIPRKIEVVNKGRKQRVKVRRP